MSISMISRPKSRDPEPVSNSHFTGTLHFVRLYLRRDRIALPLWILIFASAPALYVASIAGIYTSPEQLAAFAATTAASPAEIAMYGPIFNASLGSVGVWKAGIYSTLIAVAAILTVIRHTRAEEENGRTELLDSTSVGRYSSLTAALVLAGGASVVTGILCTASLLTQNLPVAGSVAFGAALAGSGLVFSAAAAVAAQLTPSARVARGIAMSVLGAAFALRAIGDAGSGTLSWFSPLGWSLQIRAYADERWWVLIPTLLTAAVLTWVAYALLRRRDVGGGLIAEREGPAVASSSLAGTLALALRMQRGTLAAWTIGLGLYGLLIGSAATSVGGQIGDSQAIRDIITRMGGSQSLEKSFIGYAFIMLGIAAAAYSVSAALRLHSEETAQRVEPVTAGAVGRIRWASSHIVFALLGPASALLVAGLTAGGTYGIANGDIGSTLPSVLGAALVQLPAVWVLTGVTVFLFGVVPRFTPVVWGVLVAFLFIFLVGSLARLPQWVLDLEPFTHAPRLPGAPFELMPLVWLTLIAAALTATGLFAFRRRDLR
ncbi:ABC transporter permease [Rhodococcus sp. IEGM 1366]|uniref:ABC transporter permease n=1 Tax=Rhodococcus sp. IEGM 1366 TaxID=3082223 RepID=UPI00295504EA|nr:ABC transporter permease [Rhodococcus sp. IEGM 1366]MDV8070626.1 ABC transporter permease [Rhodococcus sp. IEGM 1366]